MANLRDLRRRIKSTQNMQQITKAMKAVAAAKMRKAQDAVLLARPYAIRIKSVLGRVAAASADVKNPLLEVREPKKIAYIVMTADRGLCGGFNSNIIRYAVNELKGQDAEISIVTVGRKSSDFFSRRDYSIAQRYVGLIDHVQYGAVRDIASKVIEKYADQEYDAVYLIYSQFINAMVQKPIQVKLLPAEPPAEAESSDAAQKASYIFEPSPEAVLAELLPKYIENAERIRTYFKKSCSALKSLFITLSRLYSASAICKAFSF
jgi:F-type H+-transporting ATPase subunit gamma